ncbi:MAG: Appr-1-p processing protein [Promethearchaeota archaeon CR_4]|nr:MAG: Appr-1-p processing protein [Candidatus Lokiarchaeota archaeon CR_4]
MLGCFTPFHKCIDNAIHASAGPRLRDDCYLIMQKQKTLEPIGIAKITRGYNLPATYILHTVGPNLSKSEHGKRSLQIIEEHAKQLGSCYRSCLELADQIPAIRRLAFCCISTGAFEFPNDVAAPLALSSVHEWVQQHPSRFDLIVFNVFTQKDVEIYRKLFQ